MGKAINYLGIARKAGALETGEENSSISVKSGKATLLIVAADASDNARKRAEGFVFGYHTVLSPVPYTKDEISAITGKNGCSMAVFTDIGLASSFASALNAEFGEDYSALAEKMSGLNESAQRRRKEAEARKRGGKAGNRRRSV